MQEAAACRMQSVGYGGAWHGKCNAMHLARLILVVASRDIIVIAAARQLVPMLTTVGGVGAAAAASFNFLCFRIICLHLYYFPNVPMFFIAVFQTSPKNLGVFIIACLLFPSQFQCSR